MIDVALDVEQYDCPFVDVSADHDATFAATHWDFDTANGVLETRTAVEARDGGELDDGLRALRDHENLRTYELLARRDNVAHVRTSVPETDAMATVRAHDGYITGPFYATEGSEVWHVGFDRRDVVDDALADLDRNNEFDVLERERTAVPQLQSFVQHAGAAMTLIEGCRDLSDVERQTLEAAVSGGYFESPRDANLGSLADEFDVSKPAVSKNLRRGQRKMIERVVAVLDDV